MRTRWAKSEGKADPWHYAPKAPMCDYDKLPADKIPLPPERRYNEYCGFDARAKMRNLRERCTEEEYLNAVWKAREEKQRINHGRT